MHPDNEIAQDDDAARQLLRRARDIVSEFSTDAPDAQVAAVFRHLAALQLDRMCMDDTPEEDDPVNLLH